MEKKQFGIMQGRLLPESLKTYNKFPKLWAKEFFVCKEIGFNYLELMFDSEKSRYNPLNNGNLNQILKVKKKSKLRVYSIIVNYFTRFSFGGNIKKSVSIVKKLIDISDKLNIKIIIIPLIEKSSINLSNLNKTLEILNKLLKKRSVKFSVELDSSISLKNKKKIFSKFYPNIGICYDTGNSISEGKKFEYEINYLKKYINHIHLKDKTRNKKKFVNTYLGSGFLNFKNLKNVLKKIRYNKNITLECFYSKYSIKDGEKNLQYALNYLL